MSETEKQNDVDKVPRGSLLKNLTKAKNKQISHCEMTRKTGKMVTAISFLLLGLCLAGIVEQKALAGTNGNDNNPKVEIGIVSDIDDSWTEVTLSQNYDSMVVVTTANYDSGNDPAIVRIRNASGNSFKIRVDPAENGTMNGIDIHYIVMEEGVYNIVDHGTKMEARKITSTVTDSEAKWTGQDLVYANSYTSPVVLGQVMTFAGSEFSTFWCQGSSRTDIPNSTALKVGKTVLRDIYTTRSNETIGVIIIEANSSGTMKDVVVDGAETADTKYVANVGSDSITGIDDQSENITGYGLGGHLSSASVGIANLAGIQEAGGGWAILYGNSPVSRGAVKLAIDEDNIRDTERNHTTECVGYIVFE